MDSVSSHCCCSRTCRLALLSRVEASSSRIESNTCACCSSERCSSIFCIFRVAICSCCCTSNKRAWVISSRARSRSSCSICTDLAVASSCSSMSAISSRNFANCDVAALLSCSSANAIGGASPGMAGRRRSGLGSCWSPACPCDRANPT